MPDKLTVCGLPAALSLTLTAAVRAPFAVGLNLTLMVQLAPAFSELPQVLVCKKSPELVPVIPIEMPVMEVVPTLVNVTFLAGLVVPTVTVPKFRLVGESLAVVPVP